MFRTENLLLARPSRSCWCWLSATCFRTRNHLASTEGLVAATIFAIDLTVLRRVVRLFLFPRNVSDSAPIRTLRMWAFGRDPPIVFSFVGVLLLGADTTRAALSILLVLDYPETPYIPDGNFKCLVDARKGRNCDFYRVRLRDAADCNGIHYSVISGLWLLRLHGNRRSTRSASHPTLRKELRRWLGGTVAL